VPEPRPTPTAAEVLAVIRERGGRVYRMREARAFCLTDNRELAGWLVRKGGVTFRGPGNDPALVDMPGAYRRERNGKIEWDVWIERIETSDISLWDALADRTQELAA
jgi:hypothetical protein